MVDINEALRLRSNGMTLKEIGLVFGVSKQRIRHKIGKTLELKHQFIKDKLILLNDGTRSLNEISIESGYSFSLVQKLLGNIRNPHKAPEGFRKCGKCGILPIEKFYGSSRVCIPCTKLNLSNWRKNNKHKVLEYQRKNNWKMKARIAVFKALKSGKLTKGECIYKDNSCSKQIQAHHYLGYEKENYLNVKWVCSHHHIKVDTRSWGKI